ncbi:MAG: hypothetical protein QW331_03415 [Candidatus Woesearchaeota archaeon]
MEILTYLTGKISLIEIKSPTITEKSQIAIPNDAREKVFKEGTKVVVLTFDDKIESVL